MGKSFMERYWISKKRFCRRHFERIVVGKRLLYHFIWFGIGGFYSARQSCTFRNIYQQFFFNRFSNKKYGFRILSDMCAIQYYQCMEEGVFRGLFIRTLSETKPFVQANFIAAFLFGIWHIVMPIRSYIHGEMSFAAMVLMGIGYMILSGIMGIKWGLLYRITGNIWVGLGDHLFNNTVAANMLHVISAKGTDELQIVRIMAAQIISFVFVLIIHYYKNRKGRKKPKNQS